MTALGLQNIDTFANEIREKMRNTTRTTLARRLLRVTLASSCSTALSPWLFTAGALQTKSPGRAFSAQKDFARDLQERCHSPSSVLSRVGRHLTIHNDPDGKMASLVLVRLAKMMISESNYYFYSGNECDVKRTDGSTRSDLFDIGNENWTGDSLAVIQHVSDTLAKAIVSSSGRSENFHHDTYIEGMKAAGVLARLLFSPVTTGGSPGDVFSALGESFHHVSEATMDEHHLSGLNWAYGCLSVAGVGSIESRSDGQFKVPRHILSSYDRLKLPFRIRPGFFSAEIGQTELTVANIKTQVKFRTEEIKTTATKKIVKERRQTAWEGEDYVPGFAYSGKKMETSAFSPIVRYVRDKLHSRTGISYDCCLLNLYPDGDSGMRYHIDPDQGDLWGYNTAVVSVGAARRFAFRETRHSWKRQPHNFVVMDGDVVEMFGDCQLRFQHTVKTAEGKYESAPRCSMVFKQCLQS